MRMKEPRASGQLFRGSLSPRCSLFTFQEITYFHACPLSLEEPFFSPDFSFNVAPRVVSRFHVLPHPPHYIVIFSPFSQDNLLFRTRCGFFFAFLFFTCRLPSSRIWLSACFWLTSQPAPPLSCKTTPFFFFRPPRSL